MTAEEREESRKRQLDEPSSTQDREKRSMEIRLVEENGQLIAEGLGRYATSLYPGAFVNESKNHGILHKVNYGTTYTAIRLGETSLELMDGDHTLVARREDFELGDEQVVMRWKLGKAKETLEDGNED